MAAVEKFSIALPTEIANIVREAVEAGGYSSQSEVVSDALREWKHRRDQRAQGTAGLNALWREAVADNSEGIAPDPIFEELERKYDSMADATVR